jgi:hypothetical protein
MKVRIEWDELWIEHRFEEIDVESISEAKELVKTNELTGQIVDGHVPDFLKIIDKSIKVKKL